MKKAIQTSNAPTAIGPYSQAIQVGNTLYISGQIPLDPQTGELVNGDIKTQTKQILKNIDAILKEAGATASNIVRTTVFLTDLNNFKEFNETYAEVFTPPYPARSTVQVAALPKNTQIEIECIAHI